MLTVDKLRTYEHYGGDIDGWSRASRGAQTSGMTDDDWFLIDELLMGLASLQTGRASPAYALKVEQRLLASTSDPATRSLLMSISARRRSHDAA